MKFLANRTMRKFAILVASSVFFVGIHNYSTSALTTTSSTGIQFSFNSSLTMNLSSNDVIISNLTPGNYATSNTIVINVESNNSHGYTLTAKVGDRNDTTYSNNNLVDADTSAVFSSLAVLDKVTLANFADSKWGYTTDNTVDSGSTFSGLLYDVDTVINATKTANGMPANSYPGTSATYFTMGAKAGSTQAAGEYHNVINFRGVANVDTYPVIETVEYMQDFGGLSTDDKKTLLASMEEEVQYQLKDSRDGNSYNITKLSNGSVWMTTNLNLTKGLKLTSADTNTTNPHYLSNSNSYVLNSNSTTCGSDSPCYSYYRYHEAVAGFDLDSGESLNDICPKGWKLPTRKDFEKLQALYPDGAALTAAPFNAEYSGEYEFSFTGGGAYGSYWTNESTLTLDSTPESLAHYFEFYNSGTRFGTDVKSYSYTKRSIRCILK